MAEIRLAPGEMFEHWHQSESITRLNSGRVQMMLQDQLFELTPGEVRYVAAEVGHRLINVGTTTASVECYHDADESGNGGDN